MSECVVRMEMPKNCHECPVSYQSFGDTPCWCKLAFEKNEAVSDGLMWREVDPQTRPDWCPIICQLPEGHGRLGDLDEMAAGCDSPYWCRWLSEIEDSPTIVPAERSET